MVFLECPNNIKYGCLNLKVRYEYMVISGLV